MSFILTGHASPTTVIFQGTDHWEIDVALTGAALDANELDLELKDANGDKYTGTLYCNADVAGAVLKLVGSDKEATYNLSKGHSNLLVQEIVNVGDGADGTFILLR